MDREKLTRNLIRMIETVDEGRLPARVRAFYVFGSYARGALRPGDLDVLVVHDDPGEEYWSRLKRRLRGKGYGTLQVMTTAVVRFHGEMRRGLRRPGEQADILLARGVDEVVGPSSNIQPSDLVLLWSEQDRDYRPKLDAVRPDPAAGRAPRDHLVSMKRLNDEVGVTEAVAGMVADMRLSLTRLPVADVDCSSLNAHHSRLQGHWAGCKLMGRKSLGLLPCGMRWLQRHRQRAARPHQMEMYSESGTHRVHLGRPSLGWMLEVFGSRAKVRRQCLMPHLSKVEPNELLAFERGPNWGRGVGGV